MNIEHSYHEEGIQEYEHLYKEIYNKIMHKNISIHGNEIYIQNAETFMSYLKLTLIDMNQIKGVLVILKYLNDNWNTFKIYPPNTKRIK